MNTVWYLLCNASWKQLGTESVCPRKIPILKPHTQEDGIWRQGFKAVTWFRLWHEEAHCPHDEIAFTKRKKPKLFLSAMWGHSKMVAVSKPSRELSPELHHLALEFHNSNLKDHEKHTSVVSMVSREAAWAE